MSLCEVVVAVALGAAVAVFHVAVALSATVLLYWADGVDLVAAARKGIRGRQPPPEEGENDETGRGV